MVFVRYVVEALARHGGLRATLVTSPRGQASRWLAAIGDDLRRHLSIHVVDEPAASAWRVLPAKLARQFAHTRLLQSAVRAVEKRDVVDHVFIPFVDDYCLFPFATIRRPFGAIPWSGIAVRPRFHLAKAGAQVPPRRADRVEQWAYRGLLRSPTMQTLFCIDPCFAPAMGDPRVVTVDDPADIADHAGNGAWLPVADDAVVLLAYGYIDHRKAIGRLLKIVADPRMPKSLVLALVGIQDAGMQPVLRGPVAEGLRAEGRLIETVRHVTEAEEASAFMRADIIWGYYPGSYCSSGAMVRAGQMGRPLMAGREGLVGYLTHAHGFGLTAGEHDDEAVLRQLARLATTPNLRHELGEAGRRHFADATGAAFGDRIIRNLMGSAA